MTTLKELLATLVYYPSITPSDQGCQDYIADYLAPLGFTCQRFNNHPVANLYAEIGNQGPLLLFAGHTDVVLPGNRDKWRTDPFIMHEENDIAYGRGVADMKGSIASMLIATNHFLTYHRHALTGRLGFLITSGEEGQDFNLGTPYVMQQLHKKGITPHFCIVGEPSSTMRIGDVIKIGRRGSLSAQVVISGTQGHVAYPHLANNPIHAFALCLHQITSWRLDKGNSYFEPSSLQITRIESKGGASNVIPGHLELDFNIRFNTEQQVDTLKQTIEGFFKQHGLNAAIQWQLNGEPFLTSHGKLLTHTQRIIEEITGYKPQLTTGGGTSDGRFIAPYGVEVIELGPINATIHQANECVSLTDLHTLSLMYQAICQSLLT